MSPRDHARDEINGKGCLSVVGWIVLAVAVGLLFPPAGFLVGSGGILWSALRTRKSLRRHSATLQHPDGLDLERRALREMAAKQGGFVSARPPNHNGSAAPPPSWPEGEDDFTATLGDPIGVGSSSLAFTYVDRDGVVTERTVVDWTEYRRHLRGFCLTAGAPRTFRKDRIESWQSQRPNRLRNR